MVTAAGSAAARHRAALAGVLVLTLAGAATVASAQETSAPVARPDVPSPDPNRVAPLAGRLEWVYDLAPQETRARIGLFLETACDPGPAEACNVAPVVRAVAPGGPAERAGIRSGDTLVALNGRSLATPEGRSALQAFEPGRQVRLTVTGEGGRREIRVTPEVRAPSGVVTLRGSPPAPGASGVRVFSFRSPEGTEEFTVRLDSLSRDEESVVVFRANEAGSLEVELAKPEPSVAGREPAVPGAGVPSRGYVVESADLAKRLQRARASALEVARIRLDSLVKLRGEVRIGPEDEPAQRVWTFRGTPVEGEEGTGAATWTLLPAPPELEPLLAANPRLAGAEFLELTPELAEYFEGVKGGLLVLRVIPGTPAGRLGLRGGDVVVEANGRAVRSVEALRDAFQTAVEDSIRVRWVRKGKPSTGQLAAP